MSSKPDPYCVFGNPIAHSKSPEIHAKFAEQCGENIKYDKCFVELGAFERSARAFFASGGKGANVTVPFKEDAFRLADQLTDRAKLAGALNTLKLEKDGRIFGDTTDGAGLIWDLRERLKWPLADAQILVLGAGGAATSVMLDLLKQNPKKLTIANRTVSKAEAIAEKFEAHGVIDVCSFEDLERAADFSLVINATSASLSGAVPEIPEKIFVSSPFVYDMVYADKPTSFLEFAKNKGAIRVSDGLGMLIGQAAESFKIWRNKQPDSSAVIDAWRGA